MSQHQWRYPGRFLFWGILALIAVVTTVAAISWVFFRPVGYYPYGFGFFPFGFFGFFWIFAVFWFHQMGFLAMARVRSAPILEIRRPGLLHPEGTICQRRDH